MASGTREIKGRMKAVGNIERITKTMQLIASAQFQKLQRRATDAQAYTRKINEVVRDLSEAVGDDASVSHSLLRPPSRPVGRELMLVITSNRGLCGAYNANVLRTMQREFRDKGAADHFSVEMVGKKGIGFSQFNDIPLEQVHSDIGDEPALEQVHGLAQRYMDQFMAGHYDAVKVAYMSFVSMSTQRPVIGQLLPMEHPSSQETAGQNSSGHSQSQSQGQGQAQDEAGAHAGAGGAQSPLYEFSPEPVELLDDILPVTIKQTLYQWFNEAVVSEQVSRMMAMQAATDAANKLNKSLKRQFNRARQSAITTELSEIIGGAAALE